MALIEEQNVIPTVSGMPLGFRGELVYESARDAGAWDRLASDWEEAARGVGFHLSHAWLRAWWDTYGSGSLDIGAVREGHRLVALAPFRRRRCRLWGLPVDAVENLFNAHAVRSDIALLGRDAEALDLVLDALDRVPWDLVLLREVPERTRLLELLPDACRTRGWTLRTRPSLDSPYVSLNGSWDTFHATLSKRFRKSIRAKRNRLNASGSPVAIECVRGAGAIATVMPEVMEVAERSWSGERGSSIASPPNRGFYVSVFRAFADRDQLRVWTLRLGGRLAAFEIHVTWDRTVAPLKSCYHPAYSELSVGSVLDAHALEATYRSGEFDRYDLLGKNEFYKTRWTNLVERHLEVFVFNARRRSSLLRELEFTLRPRLGAVRRLMTRRLQGREASL